LAKVGKSESGKECGMKLHRISCFRYSSGVCRGETSRSVARPLRLLRQPLDRRASPPSSSLERDFCPRRLARRKGPEDDVSAQRPEIGDHHTREMAAKRAFLLASCQLRVSEDWVVADAVGCERVSKANNREFFEYFDPKQVSAELMAVRHSKFESDPS